MDAGNLYRLLVRAGLPVIGISIGDDADKGTWRVFFAEGATIEDRAAVATVIASVTELTPVVPTQITRFQAKEALRRAGRLAEIEAALAQVDEQSSDALQTAKLAWESAQSFPRESAVLEAFATLLNLTDQQLDALFISASRVDV